MIKAAQINVSTKMHNAEALPMIEHGSEVMLTITTPVGATFSCRTKFLAKHSNHRILLELPEVNRIQFQVYFQEGFWLHLHVVSTQGEGYAIQFRSQIESVLKQPVPMMVVTIPQMMDVSTLRKELRFDVKLSATLCIDDKLVACQVKNISKSGCQFVLSSLGLDIESGKKVSLQVRTNSQRNYSLPLLSGYVRNKQTVGTHTAYGVEFALEDAHNVRSLLSNLVDRYKHALLGYSKKEWSGVEHHAQVTAMDVDAQHSQL
ncbi:PilZ domain-containing protein [Vibrio panuliri]|uniref:Cation tolerance protein CutA n=1 Tax=Vibrio panuliri TaxID=1381081 RepID=A0ABX3FCM6_9VIBR|nr:flagellar brake protein [Vibrio panuliri]KAB1457526.1 flagellar brake protein [Vibrio panuliri]OLQ87696.1 hypothetical protein BIY20_13370 [Vibrio panuliri]